MVSIRFASVLLSLGGILISLYAHRVENSKAEDPLYEPLCDLGENMRCSDALTSEYSRGFGFLGDFLGNDSPLVQPNSVYGIGFYSVILVLRLRSTLIFVMMDSGIAVVFGSSV
ncbi:vitamin K epoxide reductase complex subunit 1-like protein 1 isoform X2 [Artemia franciscana]|uniref:vitamin K epoxide reductase complex subunit 1-like protein 1 isoform X2 n=1 Tax=Artemia franciscana TaxID=6661 RepID=UPI0032DA2F2A